jgi:hypothetical protein
MRAGRGHRLLLLGSALVVLALALTRSWFYARPLGGFTSIGPWGLEVCRAGCSSLAWHHAGAGPWVTLAGYLTVAASLATAGLAGVVAIVGVAPSSARARLRTLVVVALVAMAGFVLLVFGAVGGANPDWGLLVAPAAALLIRRLAR